MILSGSWRRMERKPRAKVSPFFLVDRNLGDAANLVFDRIFNGDDLVFVGLDFVDGGVQRCRLTAAGRPGHQHHAVRFFDVAAETAQVVFVKSDHIEHSEWNFSLIDSLSSTRSTASSP